MSFKWLAVEIFTSFGRGENFKFYSLINFYFFRFDSSDILVSNKKNIATGLENCLKYDCAQNCNRTRCEICAPCTSQSDRFQMREALREHQHSANFKRLFPSQRYYLDDYLRSVSKNNQISMKWFHEKCKNDPRWC